MPPSSLMTASEGRVTDASAEDRLVFAEPAGVLLLAAFFGAEAAFAVLDGFFDMAYGPRLTREIQGCASR